MWLGERFGGHLPISYTVLDVEVGFGRHIKIKYDKLTCLYWCAHLICTFKHICIFSY